MPRKAGIAITVLIAATAIGGLTGSYLLPIDHEGFSAAGRRDSDESKLGRACVVPPTEKIFDPPLDFRNGQIADQKTMGDVTAASCHKRP